jgi:hypothetical protein
LTVSIIMNIISTSFNDEMQIISYIISIIFAILILSHVVVLLFIEIFDDDSKFKYLLNMITYYTSDLKSNSM